MTFARRSQAVLKRSITNDSTLTILSRGAVRGSRRVRWRSEFTDELPSVGFRDSAARRTARSAWLSKRRRKLDGNALLDHVQLGQSWAGASHRDAKYGREPR